MIGYLAFVVDRQHYSLLFIGVEDVVFLSNAFERFTLLTTFKDLHSDINYVTISVVS